MKRTLVIVCIALSMAWLAPAAVPSYGMIDAQAQQRDGRPNLLELLFGGGLRKQLNRRQEQAPKNTRRVIVNRNNVASQSQPDVQEVVEKAEDASTVIVVGDFMADGLHWGLQQAYSDNPKVRFVEHSSGLSGLVRDDVVDWPERIGNLVEEDKPVAVIMFVGMNDRQQIRTTRGRLNKLTPEWRKEYEARIDRIVEAVRGRNLTLIWMGLPAVSSGNMNADYLIFNEIYRTKVEAAGGVFVDIWDGFTNAEGAFISAGPDINGQIVRLRNSDGINMTRAGKQKLAFYAERELRKAIGLGSDEVTAALLPDSGSQLIEDPEYDPAATGKTVLIALDDPGLDGSEVLAGDSDPADGDLGYSTALKLVKDGISAAPHPGRIDSDWGMPAKPEEPEPAEQAASSEPESAR